MKKDSKVPGTQTDSLTLVNAVKLLNAEQKQNVLGKIRRIKELPTDHVINSFSKGRTTRIRDFD
jgi:hypothetical protein